MKQEYVERFWKMGQAGELTLTNGDKATGNCYEEEGRWWFFAEDSNGQEYETDAMPAHRLPITIVHYAEGARPVGVIK